MNIQTIIRDKGRLILLKLIGGILLLAGMIAAFFGPLEMFCFYLFSEGGRFHYEGFRFGSFMFGNLAAQIIGYYFIAACLIPLGYGILKLQNWARHLMLAALQFWVVAGLPLIVAFFFVLISSKEVALPLVVLIGVLLVAGYVIVPRLAIQFYNSPDTKRSFEANSLKKTWIETIPVPILGLSYVLVFFIAVLHVHIFFNGIFPVFGQWLSGLEGILLIDISIMSLCILLWGLLRARRWAWWAALIYFCLMTLSYIITLLASSWEDVLAVLNVPAFEMEILEGIPLMGYHFAILVSIPFLLTLGLIVRAKPHFKM